MKKLIRIALIAGSLCLLVVGVLIVRPPLLPDPYRIYTSPEGNYRLEVYRRFYVITSPGGGGDVPGVVVLKNRKGDVIRRRAVEMANLVDTPEWRKDGVYVHLVLDWSFE